MTMHEEVASTKSFAAYCKVKELATVVVHSWRGGRCTCGNADCDRPAKHPYAKSLKLEAKVHDDIDKFLGYNIGILTGSINGFFGVDIDPRHGGDKSLELLEAKYGVLPITFSYKSGGGGTHYWFRLPPDVLIPNSVSRIAPGIDIRGEGGFLIGPGSITRAGTYGAANYAEVAEAPSWIIDRAVVPNIDDRNVDPTLVSKYNEYPEHTRQSIDRYLQKVFASIAKQLEELKTGDGEWNNTVAKLAFRVAELCKTTWTPHDWELGKTFIRKHAPTIDDDKLKGTWNAITVNRILDSAYQRVIKAHDTIIPLPQSIEREINRPPRQPPTGKRQLKFINLDEVPEEIVTWLWEWKESSQTGIPSGVVSIIFGDPEQGKSTLLRWLATQISTGMLPGKYYGIPKTVLYFSTEDHINKTLRPSLRAMGAELSRIKFVKLDDGTGNLSDFAFDNETIEMMQEAIQDLDVGCVCIDPLLDTLRLMDSNKISEVREMVGRISNMAEQTDCSVVAVMHPRKQNSRTVLDMILGSSGFAQRVRNVVLVNKLEDSNDEGVIEIIKNNIGRKELNLSYKLVGRPIEVQGTPTTVGSIDVGGPTSVKVSEVMLANGNHDSKYNDERKTAGQFLNDFFEHCEKGWVWTSDLLNEAQREGFTKEAIQKAMTRNKQLTKIRVGAGSDGAWATAVMHSGESAQDCKKRLKDEISNANTKINTLSDM